MNIERSFIFAFKGPTALKKLSLGGLYSFLFFTVYFAFIVVGYVLHVLCDALEGRDAKLPDWSDYKSLFNEGLLPSLIVLVYYSPCIVILFIEIQLGSLVQSTAAISGPILLIFLILISLFLPLALIRSVINGTLKSAFEFPKIVNFIKKNAGNYLTAWGLGVVVNLGSIIISIIALLIAGGLYRLAGTTGLIVGFVLTALVAAFAFFIASVITVHLFAQAYRASTPFIDDQEGTIRASMAVPPPLRG